MASVNMSIRTDSELKAQAEEIPGAARTQHEWDN